MMCDVCGVSIPFLHVYQYSSQLQPLCTPTTCTQCSILTRTYHLSSVADAAYCYESTFHYSKLLYPVHTVPSGLRNLVIFKLKLVICYSTENTHLRSGSFARSSVRVVEENLVADSPPMREIQTQFPIV